MGILEEWQVSTEDLNEVLLAYPSLRGILLGYVAEHKLRRMWFDGGRVTNVVRYDDHDRTKKGDLSFTYQAQEIRVEVKSLQTNTVKIDGDGLFAKFQCDASDRRKVTFPNGQSLETTCLLVGEFDLLAVNLFAFRKGWRFAFAKNKDLPRSAYSKYTPEHREQLLATLMQIRWPLQPPFRDEPFGLLDEIVSEKQRAADGVIIVEPEFKSKQ